MPLGGLKSPTKSLQQHSGMSTENSSEITGRLAQLACEEAVRNKEGGQGFTVSHLARPLPPSGLLFGGPWKPLPPRTSKLLQQLQTPHSFHSRGPCRVPQHGPQRPAPQKTDSFATEVTSSLTTYKAQFQTPRPNAKGKTTKLLEENRKEHPHDLAVGKDFLNRSKKHSQ